MAFGDSITSICNGALIALQEDIVTNVLPIPDANKRARTMAQRYDPVRREVLMISKPRFAWALSQPAANGTAPAFGYNNSYALPTNALTIVGLQDSEGEWTEEDYDTYGRSIHTNFGPPINLVSVLDIQDPTIFDAAWVTLFSYALAADTAVAITGSTAKRDAMYKLCGAEFADKLANARLASSQQNSVKELDEDVWLRSRR